MNADKERSRFHLRPSASSADAFLIAFLRVLGVLAVLALSGCANTPAGVSRVPPRQLVLELTVAGRIQPNFQYYFAMDFEPDQSKGPLPVVGPPWGNGWGTGAITHYVVVRGNQAQVFRIAPNSNLLKSESLGRPFDFQPPLPASPGHVSVTLDTDTLVPTDTQLATFNYNIIATDITPLDPQFPGPKLVDAFGTSGNQFVTISLSQNRVFANTDLDPPIERQGDVFRAPDLSPATGAGDLDIVDWRIAVRR
jgi:hypothetical protein